MTKTSLFVLSGAVPALLLACGDDEGPSVTYSDWAEEQRMQVDAVCDCYEEYGWDRRSDCIASQERIGPSQETCAREAIAGDRAAADIFASCFMPLQADFSACVDERLSCGDADSLAPCIDDFEVGVDRCELPAAIRRDVEDCGVELDSIGACTDTCQYAGDDECDDGRGGMQYCDPGTDCTDCGPL